MGGVQIGDAGLGESFHPEASAAWTIASTKSDPTSTEPLSAVILLFGAQRKRLSEEDARWICTSWDDANLAFVERVAPKLQAAIEAKQETEVVADEDMRQDLVLIFERIEAAGYMTRRMRPVQEAAATPITLPPSP
jgi:hypothetical protein